MAAVENPVLRNKALRNARLIANVPEPLGNDGVGKKGATTYSSKTSRASVTT